MERNVAERAVETETDSKNGGKGVGKRGTVQYDRIVSPVDKYISTKNEA